MLTAKGKYGLKALAHLATFEPGETTQAAEIAEANNILKKFLDAILGELRNAGMVYSRKGPGGGYMLARGAGDIKLGQVIRAMDGPLAPIACASRTAYQPCRGLQECPILRGSSYNDESPRRDIGCARSHDHRRHGCHGRRQQCRSDGGSGPHVAEPQARPRDQGPSGLPRLAPVHSRTLRTARQPRLLEHRPYVRPRSRDRSLPRR